MDEGWAGPEETTERITVALVTSLTGRMGRCAQELRSYCCPAAHWLVALIPLSMTDFGGLGKLANIECKMAPHM